MKMIKVNHTATVVLSDLSFRNIPVELCQTHHKASGRGPPKLGEPFIKSLDMSSNLITQVPPELAEVTSLEQLNLSSNGISAFPGIVFSSCARLRILDLSHNQLTMVPAEISNAKLLEELILI